MDNESKLKEAIKSLIPSKKKLILIGCIIIIVILGIVLLAIVGIAMGEEENKKSNVSSGGSVATQDTYEWFLKYLGGMEGGSSTIKTIDGVEYYEVIDVQDGEYTVGDGVTIDNCKEFFKKAAEELGINDDIMNYRYFGALVIKTWVDRTRDLVIEDKIEEIRAEVPGLEIYQYLALVSQGYGKGTLDYNTYYEWSKWDQEKDLEYGNCSFKYKDSSVDNLLSDDIEWGDGYFDDFSKKFLSSWSYALKQPGLKKRRRSDYIMFKSGWSMITHDYCPLSTGNSGNYSGEYIFPIAKEDIDASKFNNGNKADGLIEYKGKQNQGQTVFSSPFGIGSSSSSGRVSPTRETNQTYINQYNSNLNRYESGMIELLHQGVDITSGVTSHCNIIASKSGIVEMAGVTGSYGNYVKILHDNGTYTGYAHLSSIKVSVGENVSQGQVIGNMGNSGGSYGEHLHFEIQDNNGVLQGTHFTKWGGQVWVDPFDVLNLADPWGEKSQENESNESTEGTNNPSSNKNNLIFVNACHPLTSSQIEEFEKKSTSRLGNSGCKVQPDVAKAYNNLVKAYR